MSVIRQRILENMQKFSRAMIGAVLFLPVIGLPIGVLLVVIASPLFERNRLREIGTNSRLMATGFANGTGPSPVGRGGRERESQGVVVAGAEGGWVLETSPLLITCATCCFSIFIALSCPLTVGFSGTSACTLPVAVS